MGLHISQYAARDESQEQTLLKLIQQQINVDGASHIWKSIVYCFSPAMSVVEKRVELDWGKLTDLVKCRLKYVLHYGQEQILVSTGLMSKGFWLHPIKGYLAEGPKSKDVFFVCFAFQMLRLIRLLAQQLQEVHWADRG